MDKRKIKRLHKKNRDPTTKIKIKKLRGNIARQQGWRKTTKEGDGEVGVGKKKKNPKVILRTNRVVGRLPPKETRWKKNALHREKNER